MSRATFPLARHENLIVQTASDEQVIYDQTTDKAYVLSPSAAAVWRACNGKRSVKDIARFLSRETPTSEQAVWYALGELKDLLQTPVTLPQDVAGMSRRQFFKQAGLVAGAAAIPVVIKMVAPAPAAAQSAGGTGVCCLCGPFVPGGYPWLMDAAACSDCDFTCSVGDNGRAFECYPGSCYP